jgi:hypothetical protein
MRDLWIHDDDLIVATHGRAFWILDDIAPLREASASLNATHLFTPAPAYRVQRDTNTDTPLPPDEPAAANPPDGAIIDYYLPSSASGVTLEILNAKGELVRRYSSDDKPDASEEELQKQLIPLYWLRKPQQLSTAAGMHRWVWGLRYAPPVSTQHEYPIAAIPHDTPRYPRGPSVLPGHYTVRLTVDGKTSTAPLTVKMDPRVKTSVANLEKKFTAESRLASVVSESSQAVTQAKSILQQLDKLSETATASTKDQLEALKKKLADLVGAQGGPTAAPVSEATLSRTNGQSIALYQQMWQVDAEPTSSQMEALSEVDRDHASLSKQWREFKSSDLPALNRLLHDVNVPEIKVDTDAKNDELQGDEE